jgi:hypothetical protein
MQKPQEKQLSEVLVQAHQKHFPDQEAPRVIKRSITNILAFIVTTELAPGLTDEILNLQQVYDYFDYIEYGEVA